MRSILKIVVLILTVQILFVNATFGQLTAWRFSTTVDITENRGSAYTNYPILLDINTASLISGGEMDITGDDIRFATDCAGTNLIPYYIESGINTTDTKIWVRMPQINAFNSNTIYFFSGNPAATAASNFGAVFPNAFISSGNTTLSGAQFYDWFQVNAGDTIFVAPGNPMPVTASRIIVDGVIDADGAGYSGGVVSNGGGSGGGGEGTIQTDAPGAGGGGYGGNGGNGGEASGDIPGAGGLANGTPGGIDLDMGSGGGGTEIDGNGGNGGGAVQLNGFAIDVNGVIQANGQDAPASIIEAGGGGAGGGIEIIAEVFNASASILVHGGTGATNIALPGFGGGGGGSGGRAKVFFYSTWQGSVFATFGGGAAGCCGDDQAATGGDNGTLDLSPLSGAFGIMVNPLTLRQSPGIASGPDSVCINSTDTYVAGSAAGLNYVWEIIGGSVVTGQNTNIVTVNWTVSGNDSIKLVTSNSFTGCSDSTEIGVLVSNVSPNANFTYSGACTSNAMNFFDASTISSGSIVSYSWTFGDGGTSTDRNPTHVYTSASTYTVSLTVTSQLGCSSTVSETVSVIDSAISGFQFVDNCYGQTISFNNTSVGAVSYHWDFGDATTFNGANPPAHLYGAAGTYIVILTAVNANGCGSDARHEVTVYPLPIVNFDAPAVCLGNTTTVTNLTTVGSGTLSYIWNFGDGTSVGGSSPTHTYAAPGMYSLQLVAFSSNGCSDSITKSVTVYAGPSVAFTADTVCQGNTTQFTNGTSVSGGTFNSFWEFGDGNTSTDVNPSHTYAAAGSYIAELVVTTSNGCSDSTSNTVIVDANPVASFTVSAASICLGDTITFTNTSTTPSGSLTYTWNFGDGSPTVATVSPTHIYAVPGGYTVTLVANNGSCSETTTQNVTMFDQPVASFTADTVCQGNATQFVNTSGIGTGTLSYSWNFGDGSSSTDINPTHTYSAAGSYHVILSITSNNGCHASDTDTVIVNVQPVAKFSVVNSSICDSVLVQFVDSSTGSANTVYLWVFGDGDSSTVFDTSHLYAGPGSYTVTLTLTDTVTGCSSSATHTINVFARPSASFSGQNVCLGNPVQFTNTSSISSGTLSYTWNFGDSTSSIDADPSHTYAASRIDTVSLIVTSNSGCSDTVSNTVIIYPLPATDFSVGNACYGQGVHFSNLTTIPFGTLTYSWNFGDGTTDTATNPMHTFPALGVYNVTLTATSNTNCVTTITKAVIINPNPTASFLGQDICFHDTVNFTNLSAISSGSFTSFWEFGDGFTSVDNQPQYSYSSAGTDTVTLVVTSNSGCIDSVKHTVTIYSSPLVSFNAADVCVGDSVDFSNISTVPGGSVSSVIWNFGDGQLSTVFNPSHMYTFPGTYQVTLIVTSNHGCMDSLKKVVIVHELPVATIRALGATSFCFGDSVTLSAGTPGTDGYVWSNGATTQNITVNTSGTWGVTATSQFGCKSTDTISTTRWNLPNASAGNDTTISKGYYVHLHGSGGVTYVWTPNTTIDNPNAQNPNDTPLVNTTYTVLVTDANGCQDTASVNVTVLDDYTVWVTNTFTPNGDGKNDFWFIGNIWTYPDNEVLIFDRDGNKVFDKKAYNNDWNGTYNGRELPEGTYYYVLKFDSSGKLYRGAVSILR